MSEWDFLWGLEGQELMDAMSSGGTYDDWAYIERMERQQYGFDDDDYYDDDYYDEPSAKKNTMVFIDAENVSSTHAASIENEIWDIGNVAEVRYYAMQKDPATANWKSTIKEYGYKPILMAGEREKNKIDNKIIRDAKKVLNENKSIDIFVIVSRDGGAQTALAAAGIKLFGGVSGDADKAVEAFINDTLDYNPDVKCSHHEHNHGEGHTCGEHGCGSHSCH